MMAFRPQPLIVTILVVCVATVSASAQAPTAPPPQAAIQTGAGIDLSVGYQVIPGMPGVNVQASRKFGGSWSLVGEFNAASGEDWWDYTDHNQTLSGLVGVRKRFRTTTRVSPFWQVLAGGLHSRLKERIYCYGASEHAGVVLPAVCFGRGEFTRNEFVVQPGGGVTVMVTSRLGIQAQVDTLVSGPIMDAEYYLGLPRIALGGVIRFGK